MKVQVVNAVVDSARMVLETEVGGRITRDRMSVSDRNTSQDLTTIIAVTGDLKGVVVYGMSEETAKAITSKIVGQQFSELNDIALSGVAELGNVITGAATIALEKLGHPCDISPPLLIIGRGTRISTLDIRRVVVPLSTEYGSFEVQVALKES